MPGGSAVGSGAERPPPTADWGLSAEEVARRAACGLSNAQPKSNAKSIPRIIRDNAFTFFNAFNLALALLIAAVGEYKEMLFMFVIVSNTAIGIVQEIRSKLIVEKLSLISMPKAHVIRDGLESEVSVGDVVMGDLTALRMGGQVCSDAVVTHGEAEVDESLLTGESEPVMKRPGDELLSGSFIVSGSCRAKVIRVGADNFAAKIALGAKKYKKPKSTLLNSLNGVVRFTGYFILPLGALLFIRSFLFLETPLSSSVTTVAAALLGMMPKGLVLLTSVSLAVGVVKLAMRRTLVQELFSIENLSRVDVLCLDKTGTITEGRMRVSEVLLCGGGPMPIGVEEAMGLFVSSMDDANSTFAALRERFGGAGPDAPLGGARDGAMGAGGYRVGSRVPFSSSRRWGSATFEGLGTVLVGAPEALGGPGPLPEGLAAAASSGDRVVAVAFSESPSDGGVPADARIVAAIVLTDPIREDAAATLDFFRLQNVRVKIISGDSPATVSAIAAKVGFMDHASCVDMTGVPEEEIEGLVEGNSIFGRVDPSQKHAILQALKRKGHTVAMTGDGVNDVFALKDADCSVAMASGSDAARQTAQIVLLDSNFSAMPYVIMEGRRVVNNITDTASLFLVKTVLSFVIAFLSIIAGFPYPFIPIQMSLLGSAFEGIPSFLLALEPNGNWIKGDLLWHVLTKAIPTGLVIVIYVAAVHYAEGPLGLTQTEVSSLCVYLTAIAWTILLAHTCRPFNAYRAAVLVGMAALFSACAYLFADLLAIGPLGANALTMLLALAAVGYPLTKAISYAVFKASSRLLTSFGNNL